MSTTTTTSPQEIVSALPEPARRELAVWLLSQFDSDTILELLREVQPASAQVYDYEDPGPISDEELLLGAEARFLEYDREEAALENPLRGEVWLADSGMVAKTRPCLVLSIPLLDEDRALIGIVPHTTQPRGTRFESMLLHVFLKRACLMCKDCNRCHLQNYSDGLEH